MTREEAIKILDPETTAEALAEIEYYNGFSGKTAAVQAVSDACELAVSDMREMEKRRWIPVAERLPETGRKCLITNGETVKVGWLRPDGVWKTGVNRNDLWNKFSLYPPTHWMPLPEPPKEGA